MKLLTPFLALVLFTACASTPEMKWAESQNLYNGAVSTINEYRAPCVEWSGIPDAGPNHPRCYINDDTMRRLAPLRNAADAVLREMERSASEGDTPNYRSLVAQLDALVTQLLTEAARAKQEKMI